VTTDVASNNDNQYNLRTKTEVAIRKRGR